MRPNMREKEKSKERIKQQSIVDKGSPDNGGGAVQSDASRHYHSHFISDQARERGDGRTDRARKTGTLSASSHTYGMEVAEEAIARLKTH